MGNRTCSYIYIKYLPGMTQYHLHFLNALGGCDLNFPLYLPFY